MHASTKGSVYDRDTEASLHEVVDDASKVVASTREEFASIIADAEALARKAARLTDVEIARIRAVVDDGLKVARKSAGEGIARLGSRGRVVASAADNYVRERSWTAIGIAAVLGVLLAVISSSRR